MKYEKNKNICLLLDPIPIKSLPEGTKLFHSIIAPSIKEDDCSDAWKLVSRHYEDVSSQIKGIDFDQSYSTLAHAESYITNMAIAAMHRLTVRILDFSN